MAAPFTLRAGTASDLAEVFTIDDEAMRLYAEAGVALNLTPEHPFTIDERRRWGDAAARGGLLFAADDTGDNLGFAALDVVDGAPYLDQLSVRYRAMRRGVGRFLLHRAFDWSRERGKALWLTTYGHLLFNRPFYESEGFRVISEDAWPSTIAHHVEAQRKWLPLPDERVVMRRVFE